MSSLRKPQWHALTIKSKGGVLNKITSKVGVCQAFDPTVTKKAPKIETVEALWDTGATNTAIDIRIADRLKLIPFKKITATHAGGSSVVNVYKVSLFLPNKVGFPMVNVAGLKLTDADVIIGMDIIASGDFAVTNKDSKTICSYRIPSHSHIDYVEEHNIISEILKKGLGKNDYCPCNSGDKIKSCHGRGYY